jgi:hypothetical protein
MLAPWWVAAPALAVLALAVVAIRRGRQVVPVPLAGVEALRGARRRTRLVRGGLLATVTGVLAAAYVTAPRPTGELSSLVSPGGRSTVVVLDMSQSVSDLVYREIARTLEGIVTAAGENGRVGLVLFSDVAQEALPPGSQASELAPFIRFFRPRQERGVAAKPVYYRAAGPTQQAATQYPLNPWFGRFSGGTQISTGLRVARVALARDAQEGRVLLVSDLAEADYDLGRLTRELVLYADSPALDLRVIALPPANATQKAVFRRVLDEPDAVVDSLSLATGNAGAGEPSGGFSWPFALVVLVLALALAASEALATPLRWRTGEARA